MQFVTFTHDGVRQTGIIDGSMVVPVSAIAPDLPTDLVGIIQLGQPALDAIRIGLDGARAEGVERSRVHLHAPIPLPARNIFCVGKNYVEHAREFEGSGFDSSSRGQEIPDAPVVFTKAPSSVIANGEEIDSALDPTETLDYEGELAVVIGRGGRGIAAADAYDHVFGYTIVNDVTARKTQNRHKQWFLGKSPDTFCPMGPTVLTADALDDIGALRLVTTVNGEVRQDAYVRDLIFDVPTIIETISAAITLIPGDVIATGTPAGVAIGFSPPRYLKPGDTVAVRIDGIGTLENTVR